MFLYTDDALSEGAFIGGWVVERLVARGSMSNVYCAGGGSRGRAALKVLHRAHLHDRVALERFELEARALDAVRHPAVVRCLERGELASGLPYLALEWLDGEILSQRVARAGPLELEAATAYLEVLCSAVAATHAAGLVHRDLKAENVMCLDGGALKLLDFGIARELAPRGTGLTSTGHVIGSPIALAPEQIRGEPTSQATDVYQLGVLIHVMLAGRPPFDSHVLLDLETAHVHGVPPRLSSRARTPPALDAVVGRCLEKDPAARLPDAAALWRAWTAALGGTGALAVGLTVEVSAPDSAPDEAWDHVERLERACTAALARAGFELHSDAVLVLGTRLEHGEPGEIAARWRAFAGGLRAELAPPPGVRVRLAVHVAPARVEGGALVESAVLHPHRWPASAVV